MRALLIAGALMAPLTAEAFTYESTVTQPCHEYITFTAFDEVREDGGAPIIEPTEDERAMIDDLMFLMGPDRTDLVPAALAIGVRDVDLKGRGPAEIDQLAIIHGDPELQPEHCLRRAEHDEPNGTIDAIAACRQVIVERFSAALEGLGADGKPDPAKRIDVVHTLSLRGQVTSSLPLFWVELGRALHTLQDSYTHTYRADGGAGPITVTMNWIEFVEHRLDEARDGPQHIEKLDRCDDKQPTGLMRHTKAARATEEMIRIAVEPIDRAAKLAKLETLLDEHLAHKAGCTFENQWCQAPESDLAQSLICGCSMTHRGSFGIGWLVLMVLLFLRRRSPMRKLTCNSISLALVLLVAAPAFAEEKKEDGGDRAHGEHSAEAVEIPGTGMMLHLAAAASFDNPALAFVGAGRYRLDEAWILGLDAEWNPWVVPETRDLRAGSINVYATVIRQFRMDYEDVHLRTTVNAGTSILLTDLVGAPSGQVGVLLGLSVLGVEWKLSKGWYMVFDPAHIIIPIPQLKGAPFGYPQYRFTLGVQFGD